MQNCDYIYVTRYMSERGLSITFTEDWRSEMVWTLLPVSGSHNWQIRLRKIKFELQTQELRMNDFTVCLSLLCLLVWGYTETSVWGGCDERGVRRESIITGEDGYGCYLLGMAPELLQPLPGLTVRGGKKQLVPLCCVQFHNTLK